MKNDRGISLIVLVITIIVIIILAGAVILSISQNNPISGTSEAIFKANIDLYKSELSSYITNKLADSLGTFDASTINAITYSDIKNIITSFRSGDELNFQIRNGNLEYIGTDLNYMLWSSQVNIPNYSFMTDAEVKDNEVKVNKPKLVSGLTPVKYDSNTNTFVTTYQNDLDWYNYSTGKWANARSRDGSLWVWLPRYAYSIDSQPANYTTGGGVISIDFLQGTTNNKSDGTATTKIVHPAFKNEAGTIPVYANGGWDAEITGIWVAKFEAGYALASDGDLEVNSTVKYSESGSNVYGGITANTTYIKYPVFKANRYSFNYIRIDDSYAISRALSDSTNPYGFVAGTSYPHMMKNSEWGAVAYLAQSIYGGNGTQVRINNYTTSTTRNNPNNVYGITGIGATTDNEASAVVANKASVPSANQYNGTYGKLASTTGNVYGIYDMSGGHWERTVGYINNGNATIYGGKIFTLDGNTLGSSSKYLSNYLYNIGSDTQENNYVQYTNITRKGEAIWETSTAGIGSNSWFGDYSVYSSYYAGSWIRRGGAFNDGSFTGLFGFCESGGVADWFLCFRTVLISN